MKFSYFKKSACLSTKHSSTERGASSFFLHDPLSFPLLQPSFPPVLSSPLLFFPVLLHEVKFMFQRLREITSSFLNIQTPQEQEKASGCAEPPAPSITQGPQPSHGATLLCRTVLYQKSEHLSIFSACRTTMGRYAACQS